MSLKTYKYIVISINDLDKVDWETVIQKDMHTARYNRDRTKLILKFVGSIPYWYVNKPIYMLKDIQKMLLNGEW